MGLLQTNEKEKEDQEDNLSEAEKDAMEAKYKYLECCGKLCQKIMSRRDKNCMILEKVFPYLLKYSRPAFCHLLFSAVDRGGLCVPKHSIQCTLETNCDLAMNGVNPHQRWRCAQCIQMAMCVMYFSAKTAQYNWKEFVFVLRPLEGGPLADEQARKRRIRKTITLKLRKTRWKPNTIFGVLREIT